jgi:hypothetical protein
MLLLSPLPPMAEFPMTSRHSQNHGRSRRVGCTHHLYHFAHSPPQSWLPLFAATAWTTSRAVLSGMRVSTLRRRPRPLRSPSSTARCDKQCSVCSIRSCLMDKFYRLRSSRRSVRSIALLFSFVLGSKLCVAHRPQDQLGGETC